METIGKVKFYSTEKGFGFVQSDETKEDFFFHFKALNYEPCTMNDSVSFVVEKSKLKPGKLCATNIQILEYGKTIKRSY